MPTDCDRTTTAGNEGVSAYVAPRHAAEEVEHEVMNKRGFGVLEADAVIEGVTDDVAVFEGVADDVPVAVRL